MTDEEIDAQYAAAQRFLRDLTLFCDGYSKANPDIDMGSTSWALTALLGRIAGVAGSDLTRVSMLTLVTLREGYDEGRAAVAADKTKPAPLTMGRKSKSIH